MSGCGPGTCLWRSPVPLAPAGRVSGIDLSPVMIERARRRIERARPRGPRGPPVADAAGLPHADGVFDAVLASFSLELFDTPEIPEVLAEWRRVLRPGGRVVVVALSGRRLSAGRPACYERLHDRFAAALDCRPIHVRETVAAAGFDVIERTLVPLFGLRTEIGAGPAPRQAAPGRGGRPGIRRARQRDRRSDRSGRLTLPLDTRAPYGDGDDRPERPSAGPEAVMDGPAISTTRLVKFYGRARGVQDLDLEVQPGEVFGYLGPERRRQDHDDPAAARLHPADLGIRPTARHAGAPGQPRHPPAHRLSARRASPVQLAQRPGAGHVLRQPARPAHARTRRRDRPAPRLRPGTRDPDALVGEPAEAGPGPGVHGRPGAPDPRRAHQRPRSARAAGVLRPGPRGARRRPHGLPLVARAPRGGADLRPGGDPPGRPPGGGRADRRPARPCDPQGRGDVRGGP